MSELPLPVQFLATWIGTWVARRQERLITYLKEENRVVLKKLGNKVRLTDPERRRLVRIGKTVGRNLRLARRKTAVMGSGGRQVVAGTVVNRKTSVGRNRQKMLRSRIQGIAPDDQAGAQRIAGSIAHVGSVSRSQAAALRRRRETLNPTTAVLAKTETPGCVRGASAQTS
jgi:hypothetical protein